MGEALTGRRQESEVRSQNENLKIAAPCHRRESGSLSRSWIPACAGMTTLGDIRNSIFEFRLLGFPQHSDS
jgi:hypothetical protein